MLISIFVWKGIFDIVEVGFPEMFINVNSDEQIRYYIAIGFTGVISYTFFFLFTLFKDFIRFESNKIFKKYSHFFLDFIDFIAYWAMVGTWNFTWDLYDVFLYETDVFIDDSERLIFAIASLCVVFVVCAVLGVVANLFGPAGSVDDDDDDNEEEEEENNKAIKKTDEKKEEIKNIKFKYNSTDETVVEKF
jgi:hypothetical protein